jgi:hypothetical protein
MIKKVALSIVIFTLLVGLPLWLYERGLSINITMERLKLMAIVQHQKECIKISNESCTKDANEILVGVVTGQLQRSDLSSLDYKEKEKVNSFINSGLIKQ